MCGTTATSFRTPSGAPPYRSLFIIGLGFIELQLPGESAPVRYRIAGWATSDPARSGTRVSFYDRIALRPQIGQWQLWRFVNATDEGRYVYHCHIVEHEDTEMMRPFVVTVTDMTDGGMSHR
ncbi:MAG TPA: multicopper oxidase domain-containing protein [Pseudonocardiaceae bacterium]